MTNPNRYLEFEILHVREMKRGGRQVTVKLSGTMDGTFRTSLAVEALFKRLLDKKPKAVIVDADDLAIHPSGVEEWCKAVPGLPDVPFVYLPSQLSQILLHAEAYERFTNHVLLDPSIHA